jgi:hypothetical protein
MRLHDRTTPFALQPGARGDRSRPDDHRLARKREKRPRQQTRAVSIDSRRDQRPQNAYGRRS